MPASTRHHTPTRREQLVDAGWSVLGRLDLHKVFGGASAAAVAAEAGVTTGSFFHHFPNAAVFGDELALAVLRSAPDPDTEFDEFVGALEHLALTEVVRQSVLLTWHVYTTDPERIAHRRQMLTLWPHLDLPLHEPVDGVHTVADILRRVYASGESEGRQFWHEVLRRSGRVMVEPFTVDRVVVGLGALFQGLAQRHAVDPDLVDDQLFADMATVLIATLTQPAGAGRRVADITRFDPASDDADPVSPQARAGAARRQTTRRRIVAAAVGAFADGWQHVTAAEVATLSGVSTQTVLNAFGSVQGVAAATFTRHAAELAALAAAPGGDREVLARTLHRLAELGATEPGAARALLDARLEPHLHGSAQLPVDELVALDDVLVPVVAACADGEDPTELTAALVDLTLRQAVAGADPDTAVGLAVRLVPAPAATA